MIDLFASRSVADDDVLESPLFNDESLCADARAMAGNLLNRDGMHEHRLRDYIQEIHANDPFNIHIVMPLMKSDLHQFCRQEPSPLNAQQAEFSSQVAVVFAFHMCFGLDYLHKCNIVHRDLKPENILIQIDHSNAYKSTAVIADFGLARDTTVEEVFYICTRHYRPPEVITCTSKGEASIDVWSLGCILYELVTGRTLFQLHTALNEDGRWEGTRASVQLERILDIIGTPSHDDVRNLMPPSNAQTYLLKTLARPSVLRERIIENWRLSATSPQHRELWVDLILSCLQFFTGKRSTAEELCKHRLFQEFNVHYGENVHQFVVREYVPAHVPASQAVVNKGHLLAMMLESLEERMQDNSSVLASPHAMAVLFPDDVDDAIASKFRALPVQTQTQLREGCRLVLEAIEVYTHEPETSAQLWKVFNYFEALMHVVDPDFHMSDSAMGH
jgi:serine/threonine protein kinase